MAWGRVSNVRMLVRAGAVLAVMTVVVSLGAGRAVAATAGEFSDPSANALPPISAYNTTPTSCPVTRSVPYCSLSGTSPSLPPADSGSPERWLNSAYWPAEKRPDIEMYAIQRFGYSYQNCSDPSTWNHYCFLVDAEAAGYPVSHTPQVGDLFLARCDDTVLVNGSQPGCPLGNIYYIGYVEQVLSDGSFIVTEGGSDDATDSGLAFFWFSATMAANSSFIGFFPAGQSPPVAQYVYVDGPGSIEDSQGQTCSDTTTTPATCEFGEPEGVPITFTSTPQSGATFWGWSGTCSGTSTCTETISSATPAVVSASFAPPTANVQIRGFGSVQDSSGQTCTSTSGLQNCNFAEPPGAPVTFTATPQSGSTFQGWNGPCSGTGSCTVSVTSSFGLTANFAATSSDTGDSDTPAPIESPTVSSTPSAGTKSTDATIGIVRVTTARGTIHATLRGTHLTCKLARWTGHRWGRPHVRRCGTSVTYRHLTAGRYRLTIAAGTASASKIVRLR